MFRPRKLIWLALFVGIGYTIWRWRQGQTDGVRIPAFMSKPAPAAAPTPAAGKKQIVTNVHRGAPPSISTAAPAPASKKQIVTRVHRGTPESAAAPAETPAAEEPPPAPSAPPASPEQSLAPVTPEEVTSSHAEPEPPASPEQSLAPLAPEELIDAPEQAAAESAELGAAVAEPTDPVNINSADRQTLIDVPGIGPTLADRIIAYREQNGPFESVDALIHVQGIGEVSLSEFRHLLTV